MNGLHRDADAPTFAASRSGARDDAGLLRRIGRGDEDAMAAFYREYGQVVFAQVLLVAGERVLAEEIVQDTMLAVWRGAAAGDAVQLGGRRLRPPRALVTSMLAVQNWVFGVGLAAMGACLDGAGGRWAGSAGRMGRLG